MSAKEKYIALLKDSLLDFHTISDREAYPIEVLPETWKIRLLRLLDVLLQKRNFGIYKLKPTSEEARIHGMDWPSRAKTMVGLKRLTNIEQCLVSVIANNIEGDFVETGVWRGGVLIFIKALLDIYNVHDRAVWGFDSFEGLPKPNAADYPLDAGNRLHRIKLLASSEDEVLDNFRRYGLSTENVHLVKGWFKDTLAVNEVDSIAILRLDGDLYESTWLALTHLYPKVTEGGFVIVDDYHAFESCRQAVDRYLILHDLQPALIPIDKEAIYWQK